MNQIELNKKAAYALGFYHALYDGFQHNPFMDQYYNDSAKSVILYFLSNASSFRGERAKALKAELKALGA